MIQTRYQTLYVCEVKFSRDILKKDVILDVRRKIDKLYIPKGISYCPVLIHVNGVHDSVIDSGYFTEIIDFCESLEGER